MYRRNGPSCMSQLTFVILGGVAVLIVLMMFNVFNPLDALMAKPEPKVTAPGPAIVQQLRARNEWITFSYHADQLINAEVGGNLLQNLLFGDRILLQARGEVAGGIDMGQLRDDMIVTNGTAITMTLPPARIIYSKIDNNETRIYDRERGWLSKGDVNLETQARIYAEESILASACEGGVLDRAAAEAHQNVTDLLKSLNYYTSVTVYVSKVSECAPPTNVPTPGAPVNPTRPPAAPTVTPQGGGSTPAPATAPGGLSGTVIPVTPSP
ncbi:MAG TPA: DUF4230 domain-containing protein [Herpetosiphonaceae bacterium]